ncbi:MraY family glycosyltransferase [Demequina sediminicola]|uniref:MraY family glycosyltransferase n=1 Tax=Demequina sediminicola TaxID=1095026 RepID=UPI0009E26526|nr:MraY family glycosyltransferase [Demequina sediminicola]
MKVYLTLMVIAALVTYAATPAMRHLSFKVGAVTAVRARDVHRKPMARLGGIAILGGIAGAIAIASNTRFLEPVFEASNGAWGVLGGAALVCALGMADDVWDLDWMAKLAGQILAALIMAWSGVQLVTVPIAGLTIGSPYLSLAATVIVVVVAMNAVNFVDGLDGLAAGMIAIGGAAFFTYTYVLARSASPGDYSSLASLILAVLVGACLGFLPHNVHPARIFMGDSGAMTLGLTIAGAAIIVTGQIDPEIVSERVSVPAFIPIVLPLMVVAIPLLDMTLAVVRRLLQGKSPFMPDAHHLHHVLLRAGHSHRWAVSVMYLWTALLSFGTVSLVFLPARTSLLLVGVGAVITLVITFSPAWRRRLSGYYRAAGTKAKPLQRITPEGQLHGHQTSEESEDDADGHASADDMARPTTAQEK